jgi:hypothetical protein
MSQYKISKKRLAEIIKEEYSSLLEESLTHDQVEMDEEDYDLEEKLDPVGEEDEDVDNDGDVDSSDKYLKKRRQAIGKAMKKESLDSIRALIQKELKNL